MNVHSAPKVQSVATLSAGDSLNQVCYKFNLCWSFLDQGWFAICLHCVGWASILDPWMVVEAAFDFSNVFQHHLQNLPFVGSGMWSSLTLFNVHVNLVHIFSWQPGPTIWDSPVAGRTILWADHGGTSQPFQTTHTERVYLCDKFTRWHMSTR